MENTESSPKSKKMNPIIIGVVILAVIVIAVGGFFMMNKGKGANEEATESAQEAQQEQVEEPNTQTQTQPEQQGSALPGTTSGEKMANQVFTVEGGSFYFKPNELKVKKGVPVTITFSNKDGFHDFVIDEFTGARTNRVQTGKSETITFTPDKVGKFEFYCSVGSHRQMGMKGTLIVE